MKPHKDIAGLLFELVTFSNGISDYFYSQDLHKVNIYCNNYGLNANDYTTFHEVYKIVIC